MNQKTICPSRSFQAGNDLHIDRKSSARLDLYVWREVEAIDEERVASEDARDEFEAVASRARAGLVSASMMVMPSVIPSEKSSQKTQMTMYLSLISLAVKEARKKMSVVPPLQFFWLYAGDTKSTTPHAHWSTTWVRSAIARKSRCLPCAFWTLALSLLEMRVGLSRSSWMVSRTCRASCRL